MSPLRSRQGRILRSRITPSEAPQTDHPTTAFAAKKDGLSFFSPSAFAAKKDGLSLSFLGICRHGFARIYSHIINKNQGERLVPSREMPSKEAGGRAEPPDAYVHPRRPLRHPHIQNIAHSTINVGTNETNNGQYRGFCFYCSA